MRYLYLFLALVTGVVAYGRTELRRQGTAVQLTVDGRPWTVLGGELGNSTASSVASIREVMPRLRAMNLNTVLVPVYWDMTEPREGEYDFTLIDATLEAARANDLKVILLWFGAWKNSMSCYAPLWFKENYRKYHDKVFISVVAVVNGYFAQSAAAYNAAHRRVAKNGGYGYCGV